MKILKINEYFNNFNTMVTTNSLLDYYNCEKCDALWKSFNQKIINMCPYCETKNAKIIDEDSWYEKVKDRLEVDEIEDLEKERNKDNKLIDLFSVGKDNSKRYVN